MYHVSLPAYGARGWLAGCVANHKSQDACVWGIRPSSQFITKIEYIRSPDKTAARPGLAQEPTSQSARPREKQVWLKSNTNIPLWDMRRQVSIKEAAAWLLYWAPNSCTAFQSSLRQPESFLPPPLPVCQLTNTKPRRAFLTLATNYYITIALTA